MAFFESTLGKAILGGVTGGLTSGIKQRLHNRIAHNQTHPSALQQAHLGSPAVATPTSLSDNIEAQKDLADHNTMNQMLLETHRANLQKQQPNLVESFGGNLSSLLSPLSKWYKQAEKDAMNRYKERAYWLPDYPVKRPYKPYYQTQRTYR